MGKRKSTPKNTPHTSVFILISGFLIGLFGMGLFLTLIGIATETSSAKLSNTTLTEIVTVPFNQYEPTFSQYEYSETVTLRISGTGQAAGNDFSDAFYLYTQNGQALAQPLLGQFDLEIDDNRAVDTLELRNNPPAYHPEHVYTVTYNVGLSPRHIAFRIADITVDDNHGTFTIEILD